MQLTPRYDDPAFLQVMLPLGDPAVPLLRQRRRLGSLLGQLDDEQWATASRCAGWTVQDVVTHLVSTNQFWAFSIRSARTGEPTRFLATFDPVASPAELVDAARSQSSVEVRDQFLATTETLADAVAGLDDDAWSMLGEAPPGHVPLRAVALHALWDAWIHERDITRPLGLPQPAEEDEIAGCLAYCTALGPALMATTGATRQGTIAVDATDPDVHFVIEVGESVVIRDGDAPSDALSLTGPAVELVEALSFRAPLSLSVADEHQWLLHGLAEVFDREL